jgi:hypothetical protein
MTPADEPSLWIMLAATFGGIAFVFLAMAGGWLFVAVENPDEHAPRPSL